MPRRPRWLTADDGGSSIHEKNDSHPSDPWGGAVHAQTYLDVASYRLLQKVAGQELVMATRAAAAFVSTDDALHWPTNTSSSSSCILHVASLICHAMSGSTSSHCDHKVGVVMRLSPGLGQAKVDQ